MYLYTVCALDATVKDCPANAEGTSGPSAPVHFCSLSFILSYPSLLIISKTSIMRLHEVLEACVEYVAMDGVLGE